MKKIFLGLFLIINSLFGVNLLNYDIFDNSDTIDITLLFDSAYSPNIYQNRENDRLIITLKGVNTEEKYINQLNSKITNEFIISPSNGSTKVIFNNAKNLRVKALAGKGNLSLTLQISNINISKNKIEAQQIKDVKQNSPKKDLTQVDNGLENLILIVVGTLFGVVLALAILKILLSKKSKKTINQWDIFSSLDTQDKKAAIKKENLNDKKIVPKIVYFKQIADQKIVIISFNGQNYMISFNENDNLAKIYDGNIEDFKEFIKKNPRILVQTLTKKYSIDEYIKNASYDE